MLPLLLLALGAPGAAPFVIQVASWCSLATNGSFVATNATLGLLLALAQVPLVCGDFGGPRGPRAVPCPGGGPLAPLGESLARDLNKDPRWGQRLRERGRLCGQLPGHVWPPRSAPPRLRVLASRSGPGPAPLVLTCHAWGFTPAEVTLRWFRNGVVVEDPRERLRVLPVGDGTFRAQVSVEVAAAAASGDTFECSALHPSLEQPLSVRWAPGLSPGLALLVALATLSLLLGLLLFTFGLCRYLGPSPAPGYTPLPGATYAGSI